MSNQHRGPPMVRYPAGRRGTQAELKTALVSKSRLEWTGRQGKLSLQDCGNRSCLSFQP
jgi:hypothetical protein